MENDSYIETCAICFLSIERAKKLVPPDLLKDGIGSNRELELRCAFFPIVTQR